MSSILSFLTTPDGLALIGAVAASLGLKKATKKASTKVHRLVEDAFAALRLVEREAKGAAAIASDPDHALEVAIQAVAKAAGLEVNAKELRRAVGQLVLRRELDRLRKAVAGDLQRTLAKAEAML